MISLTLTRTNEDRPIIGKKLKKLGRVETLIKGTIGVIHLLPTTP
jgi:hypothetical protein